MRPHLTVVNDRMIRRAAVTSYERARIAAVERRREMRAYGLAFLLAAIALGIFFSQVA